MDINETASELFQILLDKSKKNGKEFTDEVMQVLTLCISEMIKTCYCSSHHKNALNVAVNQIKDDLKIKEFLNE